MNPEPTEPDPGEAEAADSESNAELLKWEVWVRVELDKEREPAAVLAEMVGKGYAPEAAEDLIARVQHRQSLDYEVAAEEREQWRAAVSKYRRNMIIGGVYFVMGSAVCIKAWLYPGSVGWLVVLVGAACVAFGSLRFAYGLLGYVRPMSIRLDGRYVPGRRIGTYSPGTPRSRYSRFT